MLKIIRIICINLLFIFAFLILLEGATRVFLYFKRGCSTIGLPERTQYLHYQPFVMFGPEWDKKFSSYKERKNTNAYRIFLIGGSTTASFPTTILESAFERKYPNLKCEVINASYGCYNSRQELLVTVLWAPDLDIDMIISLDGANDLIHRLRTKDAREFYLDDAYKIALEHPFRSPLVHIMRYSQFIQAIVRFKNRVSIGPVSEYVDCIPVYISSQHSINILAKGMAADRIMVLQPFMAFKNPLSEGERKFNQYKYREDIIKEMYELLHQNLLALSKRDGILYSDSRYIFDGIERTIFSDDVHFISDEGYRILAERIISLISDKRVAKRRNEFLKK